jgi:hypothetical protein
MRTATLTFVAVLTTAALGSAYCMESAATADGRSHTEPAGTLIAADSSADPVNADRLGNGLPATGATAEIPPADKDTEPAETSPAPDQNANDAASTAESQPDQQQGGDDSSQAELPPHVYSLQDFVSQGLDESPLGIELREDCSKLADHEKVCGLAVLDVRNGSPADRAGIKRYTALAHDLLDGASVAAALVFPPAIVAVAVIDQSGIGENFDLVIGVDGRRVRHILDFQDFTSNVRPGDTVYLTIVRAGKRVQVPVQIPTGATVYRN